jgi:hypothetical protein
MTYDVQTPGVARLWPYAPDWSRGFEARRSFQTDIQPSRNRTEQRRAVRFIPRRSARYRTVVSGADRRAADHFLRLWQNKPTVVPDFARWARLTAGSSGGATTLTISPMPAWVAEGQTLVLCGTGNDLEQVLVDGVAGTTVTLSAPLESAWANGSVIRPTFFGLLSGELAATRLNRDAAAIDVSVTGYPGGEPPRAAGTAWATFSGKEVLTLQPDYASPPSIDTLWPVEQIDYGRGRTAEFRPVEQLAKAMELSFNGQDVTATTEIEQFFDRHFGRRNTFYAPTWEQDLVLGATSSGTTLTIDGDLTELDTFDAVAICKTDGTILYRTLSNPVLASGDTQFTVASLGTTLTTSNVARISWMPLVRFASDELVTVWRTPLSASIKVAVQQVSG